MLYVYYIGDMKYIGNKLKVLRAEHNLTQDELAKKLKISRTTVIYLENGQYMPSLLLAFQIAHYFQKSIQEIFIVEPS